MTTSAEGKTLEEADAKSNTTSEDTQGVADQPENKLNNLRDNSVDQSVLLPSKMVTPTETVETKPDEDNSIAARLARTGYVLNENQITGERWVGISVQRDPDADASTRAKTKVTSIAEVAPRKGLTVKPTNGEPFAVSDEFDRSSSPADWFAVIDGNGKPFLK